MDEDEQNTEGYILRRDVEELDSIIENLSTVTDSKARTLFRLRRVHESLKMMENRLSRPGRREELSKEHWEPKTETVSTATPNCWTRPSETGSTTAPNTLTFGQVLRKKFVDKDDDEAFIGFIGDKK
jgi:hypothetical protein